MTFSAQGIQIHKLTGRFSITVCVKYKNYIALFKLRSDIFAYAHVVFNIP